MISVRTEMPACSRSNSRASAATRWLSGISSITIRRAARGSAATIDDPSRGPCMYVQHDGMFFGHTDEPIEAGHSVPRAALTREGGTAHVRYPRGRIPDG